MSSITKQANGRWRARYRDASGRSRSQTFDRKQDATGYLDDTSTDQRRGEWIDPRSRRDTFDHWADRWWATTVKLRPTTRRGYHGVLERHVRPYFTGRKLVDIDYMDVEEFIADRLHADLSPKYVRECVSVLSLIMRSTIRSKVRRDNPAAAHHIEVRRRKIREGDVLDMSQAHQLIAEIRDPYKPAVWLLILAGLRPAELCGLRVRSVDMARGLVHVTETLLPVHKFGDESYQSAVEGPPKTAAGDRTIPIPAWLALDLAEMLAVRAAKRGTPIDRAEHLFQSRYGNPVNRDKFRENVIRPALRRAGLPESIRTYDLRHSHASLLIDLGANVLAISQRMGHSDSSVTLREYGHLFEGTQERLTEQLDGLRESTANTPIGGAIVDLSGRLAGHEQDTRDTRKTQKTGQGRSKRVEAG
jgi:integrase